MFDPGSSLHVQQGSCCWSSAIFPSYLEGKKRFQNGFGDGVASSEVSMSLTTFCRAYHRDIPVGKKKNIKMFSQLRCEWSWLRSPCSVCG